MQTPHTGPTNRPTALAHASLTLPRGGWIYGAFMLCWLHGGRADPTLPVSTNAGETNFSLTSPTLHPGVDVGAATGTYSTDGHSLTIHQTTATTILDWNSFNIAAGNTVQKAPRSAVATTGPWFWTVNLALLGASVANVETLHNCVNCTFVPTNLHDRAVLYGIGLPLDAGIAYLGYHLKKNGHRWWYVPAVALTGVNAGLAAHWAASTK